jgi:hypothetical protein
MTQLVHRTVTRLPTGCPRWDKTSAIATELPSESVNSNAIIEVIFAMSTLLLDLKPKH